MTTLQEAETFWAKVCFDRRFQPNGRYRVYRELVTERMYEVLKSICPVTYEILGEAKLWDLLWDYLQESPPKSEILREVPGQVAEYLRRHSHPILKPYPYLAELIEYEFLEVRMMYFPEDKEKIHGSSPTRKRAGNSVRLRINPAHFLAVYRWPVHFIKEGFSDPEKIPRGTYHLLLWRHPRDLQVQFMEVNSLAASLIRILEKGQETAADLLTAVARENDLDSSEEFLKEGEVLLKDLLDKHILFLG